MSIFSLPVSFPGFHGFQIKDGGKVKLAFFLHQNTVPRCNALIIMDTCAPGLKINIQLRQTVKGIFNFAAQTSIVWISVGIVIRFAVQRMWWCSYTAPVSCKTLHAIPISVSIFAKVLWWRLCGCSGLTQRAMSAKPSSTVPFFVKSLTPGTEVLLDRKSVV